MTRPPASAALPRLIFNKSPNDQLRLVTSLRGDHYQVPVDLIRKMRRDAVRASDVENERDDFVNFSWLHTWEVRAMSGPFRRSTISIVHTTLVDANDAAYGYRGRPRFQLFRRRDLVAVNHGRHNVRLGLQVFGQRDNEFFGVTTADGSVDPVTSATEYLGQRRNNLSSKISTRSPVG